MLTTADGNSGHATTVKQSVNHYEQC